MTTVVTVTMIAASLVGAGIAVRRPPWLIVFLLSVAGMLRFDSNLGDTVGGQSNLSSLWLLVLILCSLMALPRLGILKSRLTAPEVWYLLFLLWAGMEAMIADDHAFALRMYLKLFSPLLAMFLARVTIRSVPATMQLLRWIMGSAFIAYLLLGGLTSRFAVSIVMIVAPFCWPFGAFADYAALMAPLALVCWRLFRQWYYLGLALLLATSGFLANIRTGILATLASLSVFALLRFGRKGLPLVAAMYIGVVVAVVTIPGIRDKTFRDQNDADVSKVALDPGSIDIEQIDSSGRTATWTMVLDRFFWPSPTMGSGLGSTQTWFYHGGHGILMVEHSEYVRLLADTGLVGLGLYLLVIIGCMKNLWTIYRGANHPLVRSLSLVGLCMFPAYLVSMGFDNVLNYVLPVSQFPFAFTGAAIGLHQALTQARQGTYVTDPF
jgi:hypothetical protein